MPRKKPGPQGPYKWLDSTVVAINGQTAKTSPYKGSEKRAMLIVLIDRGGRATVGELCEHYNYDVRQTLQNLKADGWITIC